MTNVQKLSLDEIEDVLESLEPYINHCLMQTCPENRNDLKQHLYYKALYYLKNMELKLTIDLFV